MENQDLNSQNITPESHPVAYTLSVSTPDEVAAIVNNPQIEKASRPTYELTRNVFFVGFMVAGKTSTSRRLARQCGLATIDLDAYIERRERRAINQIFADQGEQGFRDMETEVLEEFAHKGPMLVSCGGGIVLREENRKILKENGFVVYLQVTAEQAVERVGDVSTRPLFKNLETARKTIEGRLPMYEDAASVAIDTNGKSINMVAQEIQDILEKEGILCLRQK
jgi:shikimate kinase